MTDLTKKPLVRLIEALNYRNPNTALSLNDLAVTAPVINNDVLHNTRVVITPLPNVITLKNKRTVFYNRLNLQTVFTQRGIITINPGTATNTHELLPLILEQAFILLEPVDIVLADISTPPFILQATPTSYGWLGQVSLGISDTTTIRVFALDNGDIFGLDNGSVLAIDDEVI